jgi:hypothetical protein
MAFFHLLYAFPNIGLHYLINKYKFRQHSYCYTTEFITYISFVKQNVSTYWPSPNYLYVHCRLSVISYASEYLQIWAYMCDPLIR